MNSESNQLQFKTSNDNFIHLDDLEERCIKYVRNVRIGLKRVITLDQLKRWLVLDYNLIELPNDNLLNRWLEKWTDNYLLQWSYENDHKKTVSNN